MTCVANKKESRNSFLADNATTPSLALLAIGCRDLAAASPSMMPIPWSMSWNSVPHEHACSRCCFEDLVNAFNFECRALFVGASANCVGHAFALLSSYPRRRIARRFRQWVIWPQICFASNEDDGNCWSADASNFFYPL